ncbi:Lactate utilization protein C [Posidoniimonas polymericola]|uniref:Lactate utilization protein C n=1 Tax=Posidoniimonas polymericola TaxID=2528002 RepID=A0A5C5YRD1_9BACT|nr:lactate utilization protein [Posidoniimonas polymericola]TWT77439.1 Lactate utilization protein C [Posidoniimonas polymericola]
MSDHREAILGRVREALRRPTDPHVRSTSAPATSEPRAWLPAGGDTHDDRVALFAEWSDKLKTSFITVADESQAAGELARIAAEEGWTSVGVHTDPLVQACTGQLTVSQLSTDGGYDPAELEKCDAGITACDALVAQTGSVVLTTASAGGRALSVLPPHHVAIARRDQLLPDLPSAYELLRQRYAAAWPSFMTIISGPSRTGDIERILVLGAHGPKKLTVILVG